MTHSELVEIGYKWVMSRCGFAFKELRTLADETPDVIGFNSNGTFVIEAKISKADFLKDKKKPFRNHTWEGMGDWRFYICEKGLISIDELPYLWGLIEVTKGKAQVKHNPFGKGNICYKWIRNQKNNNAERKMMYSALRRLEAAGVMDKIYKNK